jgi:hypothetical protein
MDMYTAQLHQRFPLVGIIGPKAFAVGANLSGAVDMSKVRKVVFWVATGTTLGTTPTIDFKVQASASAGGTYADVDTVNCAVTQLSAANRQSSLEIRSEYLAMKAPNKPFIKGLLTIGGTGASEASVYCFGADMRYVPPQNTPQITLASINENIVPANP